MWTLLSIFCARSRKRQAEHGRAPHRTVPRPGVGLLSGGYGRDELTQAGAHRVYEDPAELMNHIDELGVQVDR
jgi:hypothetical protein